MESIQPVELKKLLESKTDLFLVDVREPLLFADGFIPGSINISITNFDRIAPELISKKVDIIIVGDKAVVKKIKDQHQIKYSSDYISWKEQEALIDMIITIDAYEFGLDLKFDKSIHLIDLRGKDVFEEEHVLDAQNIPLKDIPFVYEDFELTDQIYIYSSDLEEAMTAASLFKKRGFNFVKPIEGGFEAILKEDHIKTVKKKKKS